MTSMRVSPVASLGLMSQASNKGLYCLLITVYKCDCRNQVNKLVGEIVLRMSGVLLEQPIKGVLI